MREITVAGGGLAGLGLGILLRMEGVPVTLHEAGRYPRHRVCGEFVAGRGPTLLEHLGLANLVRDGLRLRQTRWWGERGQRFDGTLPEPALGVSRHRLDAMLAARFRQLGGSLIEGSRKAASDAPGCVWATGRQPDTTQRWIGLKCHALDLALDADLEMFLGGGAYAGASHVEDGRVNIAGLFPLKKDLSAPRERLLPAYLRAHGLAALALRLERAEVDPDSCVGVSAFAFGDAPADPARLCLGDCRLIIPPFTGNGMSLALEHAAAVAPTLTRWSRGELDWPATLRAATEALQPFDARVRRARHLQRVLLSRRGQRILWAGARARVLPFNLLFRLLH